MKTKKKKKKNKKPQAKVAKKLAKKNKRLVKTAKERREFEKLRPSKKPQAKVAKKVKKKPKVTVVGVKKPKLAAYFGMENVPNKMTPAVDGLIRILRELDNLGANTEVAIYGTYHSVRVGGVPADIWSITEVSYFTPTGPRRESDGLRPGQGTCWQRSVPSALAFVAACENYLGHFFAEPVPVFGGNPVDAKAEAEWLLRTVYADSLPKSSVADNLPPPVVETDFLPLDYEEAKAAYDWLTSDGEEQADGEMTLNHLTPEEQALVVKLKGFIAKCEAEPKPPAAPQETIVEGEGLTAEG